MSKGSKGWGYSEFCLLHRLRLFFWLEFLNFYYFFGVSGENGYWVVVVGGGGVGGGGGGGGGIDHLQVLGVGHFQLTIFWGPSKFLFCVCGGGGGGAVRVRVTTFC